MKNKKALDMLNLANDEYIVAASPQKAKSTLIKTFPRKRMNIAMTCAACLLILVFGIILINNNSESFDYIYNKKASSYQKISQSLPKVLFNYGSTDGTDGFLDLGFGIIGEVPEPDPMDPTHNSSQKYEETTDNQVSGIIEEDLIKRSDKYIYYMHNPNYYDGASPTLAVYSIEGENSQKVGEYTVTKRYDGEMLIVKGFYLSEDCTRITIIISYSYYHKEYDHSTNTELISLDISEPQNIKELGRITLLGYYSSSRLVDGNILLFCIYSVGNKYDADEVQTFVPHIDRGEGFKIIPSGDIYVPDQITHANYTVVSMINETSLDIKDTVAYYSTYTENPYVSADNIYLYRNYFQSIDDKAAKENKISFSNKSVTEIFRISYTNDDLKPMKNVVVDGKINSQYWLDEYNGVLRAVTSTQETHISNRYLSADLYCINIESMNILTSVKGFAPQGEDVQSVRFDGDSAYVCTALVINLTDPVFFFDLSDIENITYTDTGDIEGYSHSLVDFGDGLCLGIGIGDQFDSLKIEIYQKGDGMVESVCSYEIDNSRFSMWYKAYLVDRENKLIGFGVTDFSQDPSEQYVLLHFDGEKLELIKSIDIKGAPDYKRAVLIDGYLYVFGKSSFKVAKI